MKRAASMQGVMASRVLDAIRTGILVVAGDGAIVHANARACAILERTPDQLEGARIADVLVPLDAAPDRRDRAICRVAVPSGATVCVGYNVCRVRCPTDTEWSVLSAVVFQDITTYVELQQERDRLLQLATVGQMMPSVLHELKNPLASITATIEVLVEELPAGDVQTQLHAVLSEIYRMRLSFDGLGAVGRSLHNTRSAAIDSACQEAVAVLGARAQRAGVALSPEIATMPLLPLDPGVVRAVLFNLIVNAIDACRPGDRIVVRVHLAEPADRLVITVEDTGRGMSPQELARCKELFFTTKANGNGIGLALCERAVADIDGELTIESRRDVGTLARMYIPLAARGREPRGQPRTDEARGRRLAAQCPGDDPVG